MSRAVLLAGAAAAAGVLATWELIVALTSGAGGGGLARLLAPLRRLGASGETPTAGERRRLAALAAVTLLAAGWIVGGPVAALGLAAVAPAATGALLRARRRRWRTRLVDAAPVVARALGDALAGGHSIRGAITEAAAGGGVPGPAGAELRALAHELAMGEPTEISLERFRTRAAAPAYDTLVAAVMLQRDAGGDLAALLRDLAASLEAASRVARDARGATAQARFTGTLIAVLPLGAAALSELAQPGSLAALLRSPITATMLVLAVVLQVGGLVAIRRLSRLPGEARMGASR
ncbi:MAG: type II secretion system F family protein [Solirubrobacterales bacterium]